MLRKSAFKVVSIPCVQGPISALDNVDNIRALEQEVTSYETRLRVGLDNALHACRVELQIRAFCRRKAV